MVEALSKSIARYLITKQAANEDDYEIIAAGWFHIISSMMQILILGISSFFLNCMPEVIAFVLGFASLKRYIGGSHASTHLRCLLGFTVMTYIGIFVSRQIPITYITLATIALSIMTLIFVLLKAPVQHPNNPLTDKLYRKMRKISVLMAVLQFAIIIVISVLTEHFRLGFAGHKLIAVSIAKQYLLCCALGGVSASFTLVLPIPST